MHRLVFLLAALPVLALQCEQPRPVSPVGPDDPGPRACEVDDDCGLRPSVLTCCGECPPAPPFEAVPRSEIDAALLELETTCAERTLECTETPACDPIPDGCTARAVCDDGRCRVIEDGCIPVAAVPRGDADHA